MKKVAKKGWCITAAVMAVSVIVCIFCFVRWERKSSDLSFQFEETTYTYEDEYYDVDKLVYLQMVGSRDKEKERKINQLLEDDRKKVMEMEPPDLYPDDGWGYGFHGLRHHSQYTTGGFSFLSSPFPTIPFSPAQLGDQTFHLSDIEYEDDNAEDEDKTDKPATVEKLVDGVTKQFIKDERLKYYPRGMNLYSSSRGMKKPVVEELTNKEVMARVGDAKLVYRETYSIGADKKGNLVDKRYYKKV